MKILLGMSTVMMVLFGALSACSSSSTPPVEPSKPPVIIHQFPSVFKGSGDIQVTEVCYDNVTYLLTDRGGITVKIGVRTPAQTEYIYCK